MYSKVLGDLTKRPAVTAAPIVAVAPTTVFSAPAVAAAAAAAAAAPVSVASAEVPTSSSGAGGVAAVSVPADGATDSAKEVEGGWVCL